MERVRQGRSLSNCGEQLTALAPRPPVELTNMEQLDGSIQWLVPFRGRRVPVPAGRQYIRLPQPDYLNF